ncbi:MAG: acylphosphatase [Planctomycetota bacterium]|jgi:acylphosphatase
MLRVTCFLSGRVQGVGMRYTVHRLASQFPITGWVENLDDGRVQIVAEGDPKAIARFLEAISTHAPGAIHRMDRYESAASGEFVNFTIHR